MRRLGKILLLWLLPAVVCAQNIPQSMAYTQIYEYLDEMATDGLIHINSAIKPYSRAMIAEKLSELQQMDSLLNKRQRKELYFYLNEYSLERDTVPDNWVEWTNRETFNLSLAQPSFHYLTRNKKFKMSIKPILGMEVEANRHGAIIHRWWGAEINMDIAHHLSIWGSYRDHSWNGKYLRDKYYQPTLNYAPDTKLGAPLLSWGEYLYDDHRYGPFLNNRAGAQYKEAGYGADYSDMKGGVSLYTWWGSIGIQRENIQWGDAYHCSNIISARTPAVPMLTLNLKPVRWFEFNYFHAWLVSNQIDSTYYYTDNSTEGVVKRQYRPMNKFMAANMFTFSPIRKLSFSFGNSIVYSERNPQLAYFIPFAFYKSLDHFMTKGLATDNQNSQVFFTISTRNLKHTHFYGSLYLDEFKFSRLKKSNAEKNPISYLVGVEVSNWPLKNLSVRGEFMRSYIMTYTHSSPELTFATNNYYMGHYMGDNAQNIFVEVIYRPVRQLRLALNYTNETKYNCYDYLRNSDVSIIAQKPFANKTYRNNSFAFDALYEVFSGCYAHINISYNDARGYAPTTERVTGEDRGKDAEGNYVTLEGEALQQYYLSKFCPVFLQGRNITAVAGLSFNF